MRNGRGFDSDHDQKSVEFPRIAKRRKVKPSKLQETPITVSEQRCGGPCGRLYSTKRIDRPKGDKRPRFAFAKCNTLPSGVQPHCVICRAEWESRNGILSRARAVVENGGYAAVWVRDFGSIEQGLAERWTMQRGTATSVPDCHWCGCPIDRWKKRGSKSAGGYHIDCIDPTEGYSPGNIAWTCTPCNIEKNSGDPSEWLHTVERRNRQYGRGSWPYASLDKKRWERNLGVQIDLAEFAVGWDQEDLFGNPK